GREVREGSAARDGFEARGGFATRGGSAARDGSEARDEREAGQTRQELEARSAREVMEGAAGLSLRGVPTEEAWAASAVTSATLPAPRTYEVPTVTFCDLIHLQAHAHCAIPMNESLRRRIDPRTHRRRAPMPREAGRLFCRRSSRTMCGQPRCHRSRLRAVGTLLFPGQYGRFGLIWWTGQGGRLG